MTSSKTSLFADDVDKLKQELSYRKHIARKLCTEYVDGINSNPVTLKFRLRVTQGH